MGSHANQLQDIYTQAQSNDPSYLAAQHSLTSKLQIIPQAKSALMPKLSASFNQSLPLDARADSHNYSLTAGLSLRLDAYYGMKVAEQSASNAHAVFKKTQQSLIYSVVDRYLAVVKQQNQMTSSRAELKAMEQRLKQVEQQAELGLVSLNQLQDMQANVYQLQVSMLQVEQGLNLARSDLMNLTNQPLEDQLSSLSSEFKSSHIQSKSLANWLETAQANNLDIASNRFVTQQAFHNYQAKDVALYPQANISMSQSFNSATAVKDSTSFTIGITGTLFDGGLNQAQTIEAKENWHASQQQGESLLRATQQQVRRWHSAVETSRKQVHALHLLHESVIASTLGKTKEYELGLRDMSDLLDAQKSVFTAQRNLANARLDLVLNQLRLKQTSGVLTGADLAQLDQWLD